MHSTNISKTWTIYLELAEEAHQQCFFEEAVEIYLVAISIMEQSSQAGSLQLANTLVRLASVYDSLRDYKSAAQRYKQAADIYVDTLGPDNASVAIVLLQLASAQKNVGDQNQARCTKETAARILSPYISGSESGQQAS